MEVEESPAAMSLLPSERTGINLLLLSSEDLLNWTVLILGTVILASTSLSNAYLMRVKDRL